jgi:hypothetical protein
MDSYALKSPQELLRLYALMHDSNRLGDAYICGYIEDILKNKGYNIVIKDNNYKLELRVNDELLDIGRKMHKAIFGKNKENVLNKEKKMKNIVIKIENNLLTNYVINKLMKALSLKEKYKVSTGHESCIMSIKIDEGIIYASCGIPKEWEDKGAKFFTITAARNADTIIEEVVKEYNKIETKTFNLKCNYNNTNIPVIVYPDKVSFNNQYLTFDQFIQLRNALVGNFGGFEVGGSSLLLFTHTGTGTKVWINKEEFKPIVDAILCRL